MKDLEIPKTEVKPAELKLAQQLIEQQTSETFDPAAYTDEVAARIEAAVQKKVEGQEITLAEAPEGGAQVIDLMEALRASLEKKAPARAKAAVGSAQPRRRRASRPSGRSRPRRRRRRRARRAKKSASRARRRRAPVRRPRRREAAAPVAQHHPRADRRRLRLARARAARRLAVLVPGPDRAAHRAGARRREGAAAADHAIGARASPPPSRGDAAVRASHRRRGRPRRRARGRQPLAGGFRPVPARVRGRSRRRLVERDRARAGGRGAERRAGVVRARGGAGARGRRRPRCEAYERASRRRSGVRSMPTSTWADFCTRRSASRRPSRSIATAIEACGNDPVLLYNLGVLLDDMERTAGSDGRVRGGAARAIPASPIATTTWRCSTKSSRSRRTRSGTWRGIARWSPARQIEGAIECAFIRPLARHWGRRAARRRSCSRRWPAGLPATPASR